MPTNVVSKITQAPLVHASKRKGIIGGSQIGTLLKDPDGSPIHGVYSSEYETYLSYIGKQENPDDSTKESFYAGNRLEEPIAQWFAYDIKQPVMELDHQYIDPDEPRLVLHPDREFVNEIGGKRYALECKTASSFAMRGSKWPDPVPMESAKIPSFVPVTLDDGRPLTIYDGKQSIMPGYYYQCLWYMALAGYDGVFLARMTDNRLFIYYVEPDIEMQKYLLATARGWLKKVDNGYIPVPTTMSEAKDKWPRANKGSVHIADSDLVLKIEKLKALNERKSTLDGVIDRCKAEIIDAIGDAETVKDEMGLKLATCKNGQQNRFDSAALKADDPDLYKKYQVTVETARVLRLC